MRSQPIPNLTFSWLRQWRTASYVVSPHTGHNLNPGYHQSIPCVHVSVATVSRQVPPICPYLHATRPVGQAPSLRRSRAEYIKTRPSNTLITYASYGNELSWTVEDCHCLWQLIIWPIDQNCSAHHRAPCPLHLLDHHSHCLSSWAEGVWACMWRSVCVCARALSALNLFIQLPCCWLDGLTKGWLHLWKCLCCVCVCVSAIAKWKVRRLLG